MDSAKGIFLCTYMIVICCGSNRRSITSISTLKCLDLDDNNMSQEAIDGMVQVISHNKLAKLYKC